MYIIYIYSIDIECREPHGRTLTPNTQRMQVCMLNPCCKRIARNWHSARAHLHSRLILLAQD